MGLFQTIGSWFKRKETTTTTELSPTTITGPASTGGVITGTSADIVTPSKPISTTTTSGRGSGGSGRSATTTTTTYATPTPTPTPTAPTPTPTAPIVTQPKEDVQRLEAPEKTRKEQRIERREERKVKREERKRPAYISETGKKVYTPIGAVLYPRTKLKDQWKERRAGAREMKGEGVRISDRERRKLQEEINIKYGSGEIPEAEFKQYKEEQAALDAYGKKFIARAKETSPFNIPEAKVLGMGFLATPRGIVAAIPKIPKPVGVKFTGVSQSVKAKVLKTKVAFKTTTGYKGIATGTTKITGRIKQLTAGRTLTRGRMGRYAYRVPSGKLKIFKPTVKSFTAVEKGITGGGKIQLIKDFGAFKVSITKPASLGVSIGRVATIGRKGKPTTSAYKSITAGIKTGKKTTKLASITASTKGPAYSRGIIKSVPSSTTKITIGKIAGSKGSFYKMFSSVQALKSVQATRSGVLAAASTTKPLSVMKTFTATKPLLSLGGFGLVSAKTETKQFTTPKATVTFTDVKPTQLPAQVSVGPFLDQETITKTKTKSRSGLGTGLGSAVIQTPTVTQTPIQTPIPIQITPQVPVQRLTPRYPPSTPTQITPYIPTPIIPRIPIIPPFKLPFPSSRGKGAGDFLGGLGSRYTPSFSAFAYKIKGKKPSKKVFTGLELRPITPSFKWSRKRKKKKGFLI